MRGIPDKIINLIVTDPPYDLDLHRGSGVADRESVKVFKAINQGFGNGLDPRQLLVHSREILRQFNGYFWCSKKQVRIYIEFAEQNGYLYDILTWHKNNPMPLNRHTYLPDTEYCVFIREKKSTFINGLSKNLYKKYWVTPRQISNGHPTPKPIEIMRTQILLSSNPGDIILDPFCGSGITLIAAKSLGRKYIGADINPDYCRLSEDKLRQEELFG